MIIETLGRDPRGLDVVDRRELAGERVPGPPRPLEAHERHPGPGARGDGVAGDLRGEGVGGVDDHVVAAVDQVVGQTLDPTEASGAHLADGQRRRADPAREARHDGVPALDEACGEVSRLTGAPEDEDVHGQAGRGGVAPSRRRRR